MWWPRNLFYPSNVMFFLWTGFWLEQVEAKKRKAQSQEAIMKIVLQMIEHKMAAVVWGGWKAGRPATARGRGEEKGHGLNSILESSRAYGSVAHNLLPLYKLGVWTVILIFLKCCSFWSVVWNLAAAGVLGFLFKFYAHVQPGNAFRPSFCIS